MVKAILITGTDGFIGSVLKEFFINEGYEVYGTTFFKQPADEKEIHFDITQPEDFSKLWNDINFEATIHTIGVMDPAVPLKVMMDVHVEGTRKIYEYVKRQGCNHFIYLSSIAVYGRKKSMGENHTELNAERQVEKNKMQYGRTKAMAEVIIEKSGLGYTLLRLPVVLGRKDTYITPSILPKLQDGTIFTCGNKNRKISLFYVKNLGSLILRILNIGALNGSFNCTSHDTTWDEFVQEYANNLHVKYKPKKKNLIWSFLTHRKDVKYLMIAGFSALGSHFISTKLYERLEGWEPPFDWKTGVKEAIEGYFESEKQPNIS